MTHRAHRRSFGPPPRISDSRPDAAEPVPRLIGRAHRSRGLWLFDPARRWPGGARVLRWKGEFEPEDGDWCIAECARGEDHAFLVEILGADDRPALDDLAVASQYRLRTRFPRDVEREAAAFAEPGADARHGREDLRERLVFTIDPEDARDHDDALSCDDVGGGRLEVGVHIADVSHYVTPGTALDREAMARGTSCYLPGGVVPMLPEALSSNLCSLVPGCDRLALSVLVRFTPDGELDGWRFAETVIHSRHRLDYGAVEEALRGRTPFPAPLQHAIDRLATLARGLRARRFARGALALEVPEVKARVDERGETIALERREHLESHELIEEFMLLANRCVGSEGARRRSGLIYRIHEPPAPAKLAELDRTLGVVGLPRLGSAVEPARALQALLRVSLDARHRRLLHRLVLRSLARARYFEGDASHFGLATREYCHFTSPIRRYPDLHNHRRVREWIRGERTAAWDPLALAESALACTGTEQNAADAEREAVKVKGLRLLEGRLGDRASGSITGFLPRGFFVELDEWPVEGFVRVSLYTDDHFVLDDSGVRMIGRRTRRRFTLGDEVEVQIARVDVPARECDLALTPVGGRKRRTHGRG